MQTGVGSLNLAQVVGSLVAWALVLGSFWGLFWLKKRRREERKERRPQREKLLRPAGYAAMRQIDALWEKWMRAAAQAVGACTASAALGLQTESLLVSPVAKRVESGSSKSVDSED